MKEPETKVPSRAKLAFAMNKFHSTSPNEAVVDAMLLCAYCDGVASGAELGYIVELRFGSDTGLAAAAIKSGTQRLRDDKSPERAIDRIAAMVRTQAEREEIFAFSAALLYADADVSEPEDDTLGRLGTALGIELARGAAMVEDICKLITEHDPLVGLPAEATQGLYVGEGARWEGFGSTRRP